MHLIACAMLPALSLHSPALHSGSVHPHVQHSPSHNSVARLPRRALLVVAPPLLLPFVPTMAAAEAAPIAYDDVVRTLLACRDGYECNLAKVAFTTPSGEAADAIFVSGERRPIVGIPVEDANSDSSPFKLVAKLRDAKVAYTFPFSDILAKYKKS